MQIINIWFNDPQSDLLNDITIAKQGQKIISCPMSHVPWFHMEFFFPNRKIWIETTSSSGIDCIIKKNPVAPPCSSHIPSRVYLRHWNHPLLYSLQHSIQVGLLLQLLSWAFSPLTTGEKRIKEPNPSPHLDNVSSGPPHSAIPGPFFVILLLLYNPIFNNRDESFSHDRIMILKWDICRVHYVLRYGLFECPNFRQINIYSMRGHAFQVFFHPRIYFSILPGICYVMKGF